MVGLYKKDPTFFFFAHQKDPNFSWVKFNPIRRIRAINEHINLTIYILYVSDNSY